MWRWLRSRLRALGCEDHEWIHVAENGRRWLRCIHCLAESKGWQ